MITDLKPYAEYKESGLPWLGQVPAHWDVRKLKQVSQRFWSGGTPQSGNDKYYCDAPHGHPWLMISDLTHQRRVRRTRKHITDAGLASRNLEILPAGTVLFSMYASLGTAAVLEIDAAVNQAIIGISTRHTVISNDFTLYSLEQLKSSLPSLASSSTQANLNAEKVRSLQLSLPPPDEQAAIVRFLDWANGRLERAIRAKRKVIALLGEQKQAIIHRAVTRGLDPCVPLKPSGIPWLGDIPQHWSLKRFKFLATINSGQVDPRKAEYRDLTLIAPNHIESGNGRLLKQETATEQGAASGKYLVARGQVIYSKIRPSLRKAAIAPCDCLCSADMYPIAAMTSELTTDYLLFLMLSQPFTKFAVDTSMRVAMPKVNRGALANCLMWYPDAEEQSLILAFVARECAPLETAISRLEREIELLREYRTRLVADVVTGKLDVREAALRLPIEAPLDTTYDDADLGEEVEVADEEAAV